MPSIFRRRYRTFVVAAVLIVFLLYRSLQNSEWDPAVYTGIAKHPHPNGPDSGPRPEEPWPPNPQNPPADQQPPNPDAVKLPTLKAPLEEPGDFGVPPAATAPPAHHAATEPEAPLEHAIEAPPAVTEAPAPPPLQEPPTPVAEPSTASTSSRVHWMKFPEYFPIAEESLILLPTGKPLAIPKIQYKFPPESAEARSKREDRLAKVKTEMGRAWSAYRQYAWMHDELTPVTKGFKDPFCGWAATLVDSLDTLWIMGMHDEFDEAAKAAATIDFTYTPRPDIPVFETVIRYLGGLLGAYDVSGGADGKYKVLLAKAEELAEILMGVFDTPNRMPILYYQWQPENVAKPHYPAQVNVAELGSLSMEFTHLAQLTGKQKYYDAVARITNALEEWQDRGTSLPGLFPEQVDASGCNRTATEILSRERAREAQARNPPASQSVDAQEPAPSTDAGHNAAMEKKIHELYGGKTRPRSAKSEPSAHANPTNGSAPGLVRREDVSSAKKKRQYGAFEQTECVPQGLVAGGYGYESYGMGGSQDSTYEYFPKQFLLLGGLEPKYRRMHQKVIAAVKKSLLYRPMVPGERDILFSAKVGINVKQGYQPQRSFEVTHLTCFLGGMFGMGGKIFESSEDVEIGKRLTDGCVWAYGSTASGIMPEAATVVPCSSMTNCPWNESVWWDHLDPNRVWREEQLQEYLKKEEEKKKNPPPPSDYFTDPLASTMNKGEVAATAPAAVPPADPASQRTGPWDQAVKESESLAQEEKPPYPRPEPGHQNVARKAEGDSALRNQLDLNSPQNQGSTTPPAENPTTSQGGSLGQIIYENPSKPLSHEEFVKSKIAQESIPPGYVNVGFNNYILRPEAIESVWYMYRITGDPTWMDKGWVMWEAIMKAVRTEVAHSAVSNVYSETTPQNDGMESFWLAETLKYFYLLYSTPDVISLDEWVLNTEAHPFRRPA